MTTDHGRFNSRNRRASYSKTSSVISLFTRKLARAPARLTANSACIRSAISWQRLFPCASPVLLRNAAIPFTTAVHPPRIWRITCPVACVREVEGLCSSVVQLRQIEFVDALDVLQFEYVFARGFQQSPSGSDRAIRIIESSVERFAPCVLNMGPINHRECVCNDLIAWVCFSHL